MQKPSGRIQCSTDLFLSDAGLVVEAIVEKMFVKVSCSMSWRSCSSRLHSRNQSSLSVTALASTLTQPGGAWAVLLQSALCRPLVEVIPALQTRKGLAEKWCCSCAIGASNRRWQRIRRASSSTASPAFYGEAIRLEEGVADVPSTGPRSCGFRMGPFALMDLIGNDINYAVTESVWTAFHYDDRYKPSFAQKRNVDAGWLGRKSGRGWHDHSDGAVPKQPRMDKGLGQDILWRILVMLINEAADAVFWGVASAEDVDRAMRGGVNYPKGLLAWAEEVDWTAGC